VTLIDFGDCTDFLGCYSGQFPPADFFHIRRLAVAVRAVGIAGGISDFDLCASSPYIPAFTEFFGCVVYSARVDRAGTAFVIWRWRLIGDCFRRIAGG